MFFVCGKEWHIKSHCPENKEVNQLEVDSYNIEEQILNIEEVVNIDKLPYSDNICIVNSSESNISSNSSLESNSKLQ